MANGDNVGGDWSRGTDRVELYKALDGVGATDDGVWIEVAGASRMGLHVRGITTATVQMRGYIPDDGQKPANTEHGFQIGSNITADEGFSPMNAGDAIMYFKVMVSAWTAGTIDANLVVVYR